MSRLSDPAIYPARTTRQGEATQNSHPTNNTQKATIFFSAAPRIGVSRAAPIDGGERPRATHRHFLLGDDADGVRAADADRRDTRRLHRLERVLWHTERHRSDGPQVRPRSKERRGGGKKKARVLGEALTDLVQASLGGEDGDVAVVARARSAAHLAGRRKISPELGVVREQGLCVLCASRTSGTRIYTPPRLPLLIPQEEEKIARSGPTPTTSLRWDPGPTRV